MGLPRTIAIIIGIIFLLASSYGFYVLIICEDHYLMNSLLGKGCPRTDFLKYLAGWRQIFISTVERVAIIALIVFAAVVGPRLVKKIETFRKPDDRVMHALLKLEAAKLKPLKQLNEFIFDGKLHPQIYTL